MSAPRGDLDRALMARAVEAARGGRPSPNPHVGAVVARGDDVISVGHHVRAGADHAEVAALSAAGELARGATLYCTLEPCNHHGRTPPCTTAIVAAGITRVVIACADPAPHVPGAVEKLRAAGIEVTVGVLEDEGRELIADFAHHITTGLPYAILKAAVTLDGRTATRTGDSQWITGEGARTVAHAMRDRADAILVGVGTVLRDDPSLTVRHVSGVDPTRVVFDTSLRTPPDAKVLTVESSAPAWIVHGPDAPEAARARLRDAGAELIEVPLAVDARLDAEAALRALGSRDVVRLLVEGGAKVHGSLLAAGLYQRAAVFVAPKLLGDAEAVPLAWGPEVPSMAGALNLRAPSIRVLGRDVLYEGELVAER